MISENGPPAQVWRRGVIEVWKAVFPMEEVPEVLCIDTDRAKIMELILHVCVKYGNASYVPQSLDRLLDRAAKNRIFLSGNFMEIHLTLATGKFVSIANGLVCLIAHALGLDDYRSIVARSNVLHWYKRAMQTPRLSRF
jgi:hypothetical protein